MRSSLFLVSLFYYSIAFAESADSIYHLQIGNKQADFIVTCDTVVLMLEEQTLLFEVPKAYYKLWSVERDLSLYKKYKLNDTTSVSVNPITLENQYRIFIKDSLAEKCDVILQTAHSKKIKVKHVLVDTVVQVNPVTLEEEMAFSRRDSMDINLNLGSISKDKLVQAFTQGIILENKSGKIEIKTVALYYETKQDFGFLELHYPKPHKGDIQKLNAIESGDFLVLYFFTLQPEICCGEQYYSNLLITVE